MATQQDGPEITLEARGDLSTKQFYLVYVDTSGQVGLWIDPDDPAACGIGVLQNKPTAAGQPAKVRVSGVAKAIGGATVAAGKKVTCDTAGKLAAAVAGDNVIGITIEAAASGKISEILIAHSSTIGDG